MFHYIAWLCLLAVVSGHHDYISSSIPVPNVQLTPPNPTPAIAPVAAASVPVPIYQHSQPAAPAIAEVHKEFYFFQAPEEPSQPIAQFSQSVLKPSAPQQQVITRHHSADPVIHYISYQTPAEAQQILQQFIGGHVADLVGQAPAFNLNSQQLKTNVNSQYVASTFSHIKSHTHTSHTIQKKVAAASVSDVNTLGGYLPPTASVSDVAGYLPPTAGRADFPPAASNVNNQYTAPAASHVESQYHVPAVSKEESPYVVDLPSPSTLNTDYLLPAISNVDNQLQA